MRPGRQPEGDAGFAYVALLIAVAVMSIGLLAISQTWVATARRQRLVHLEWVGAQYVAAIGGYYDASPGSVKTYPASVDELLEDRRFLVVRRHLRQAYANPLTDLHDWEYVRREGGRIVGVRVQASDGVAREFVHVPGS